MAQKKYVDKVLTKKRLIFIFSVLCIVFCGLIGRLSYLMIYDSPKLKELAINQWTSEVKISAKRGRILDRSGHELAVSANVYRVDLDMNSLRDFIEKNKSSNEEVAAKLAEALNMEKEEVLKILTKTLPNGKLMGSASLKRRVEKEAADKVKEIKIGKESVAGILVSADTKRYYPNDNFLAHVIGHTNSDGDGLNGVELYYNKELSGRPGVRIAEIDRKSKELPYTISDYSKPVDGSDLVLTIDEMIQHFAEKAADQALKDNKAKAVSIVIMNPKNGEILAMANKPDYNPNNPWEENLTFDELQKKWRNRSVNDTFEPGSIFKVVTAATALEENLDGSKYNCTSNGFKSGSKPIRCANGKVHGVQSLPEMLKNSCNQAFAQLGMDIGKERMNNSMDKFGFGKKTGVDLPGEAKGIVKKTADVTDPDLSRIAFGQVNTVSMMQYLAAFNTVANGGKWITPHVMKEIVHTDEGSGKIVVDRSYKGEEKQIADPEKMAELRSYLENVVGDGGGGKNAFIDGYHIAGKTGTAQKVGGSGYQPGKYVASFAGMAPASDPAITVLVSIDEPDPSWYYAGLIAAPAAKQVFYDVFNYMSMKIDATSDEVAKSMLKDVVIPEIRGQKKADAIKILKENGLGSQLEGDGEYITDVNPKPGYSVKEGSKITLYTGNTSNYNKVVAVPNLKGMSTEKATAVLNGLGLKSSFSVGGMVSSQNIEPGKEVNKGSVIKLETEIIGD